MDLNKAGPLTRAKRALNKKMSLAATLVLLAIICSGVFLWKLAEAERARDIYNWQVRLGLIADRKQAELESWISKQFAELEKLADNQSLQLYMTELELMSGEGFAELPVEEPAEATFLKNLLTVTAERGGFLSPQPVQKIKANISWQDLAGSGIALMNNEGRVIVSTRGMPPIEGKLAEFVARQPKGKKALLDMYKGADGKPAMAFSVPIYSIQSDREVDQQLGVVIGVKSVSDEIFPMLAKNSLEDFKTEENILLRIQDNSIEYISPLLNGKTPMELRIALNAPDVASAMAINEPGAFIQSKDYRFEQVLGTGRKVEDTPWILLHKIDRKEALEESNARLTRLVTVFVLAVLVVFIGLIAAWRHGSSLRAEKVALRYKNLYNRFKSQEHLLRLVSDNQPDAMFLVDSDNKYCYANFRAANDAGISSADVVGKTMVSVMGPARAEVYQELNSRALALSANVSRIHRFDQRVIQSRHIPLDNIPNLVAEEETSGVLVIEQDITALVEEKEKQERTLEQLINSLVSLVDRHDPYAAHHSARVSKIAMALAEEVGLDDVMIETAQVAGRLMNVGKILLPAALLVKKDGLKKEEIKHVHDSIYASAAFLKDITFEGPVVETIDQCLENWDGSGPKGLKGDDIIVTARIVAVANAFVAMISPRAYREGMPVDQALKYLLSDVDKKFQRSIVAALVSYIENHDGDYDFD